MYSFVSPILLPSLGSTVCSRKFSRGPRTCSRPLIRATMSNVPSSPIVDNFYSRIMIWILRVVMQRKAGVKSPLEGYSGLVEECRLILALKGPEEQRKFVEDLLCTLLFTPTNARLFRILFSKNATLNAWITPIYFSWLVGPSTRNVPEDTGGEGVLIEKCRFLDEAKCKGLCVNMCQQPVQNLFTNTLGLPLRMTPNYEDKSCQMAFGVQPLPREQDPSLIKGCLEDCNLASKFKISHAGKECTVQPNSNIVSE